MAINVTQSVICPQTPYSIMELEEEQEKIETQAKSYYALLGSKERKDRDQANQIYKGAYSRYMGHANLFRVRSDEELAQVLSTLASFFDSISPGRIHVEGKPESWNGELHFVCLRYIQDDTFLASITAHNQLKKLCLTEELLVI